MRPADAGTREPAPPVPTQRSGRRELTLAVLGSALAGALALSSSGQTWVRATVLREPPLPPTHGVLSGGQAAPLVSACGLLLLAAAVAVIAVRGAGRFVVGLLVAVAGGALAWSGFTGVTGRIDVEPGDVAGTLSIGGSRVTTAVDAAWPAVALVAGVLAVLVGVLVVLRGRSWPGMGRRYERGPGTPAPAAARRPVTAEDEHQAAWKALDRGEDPTV